MPNLRIPTPRAYWDDTSGPTQDFKSWFALFSSWIDLQNLDRPAPLGNAEKNKMLLLLLGAEGMKVFQCNPVVASIDSVTYSAFSKAVQETFGTPVNAVRARFDFFNRRQGSAEPCSEYVSALRTLAADCSFCDETCVKQQIATMLVIGCANVDCQQKLLMEKSIDCEKFMEMVKTDESARDAASHMQAKASAVQSVDRRSRPNAAYAHGNGQGRRPNRRPQKGRPGPAPFLATKQACSRCGKSHPPDKAKCPARDATCYSCGKHGHWASVCRSKAAKAVSFNTYSPTEMREAGGAGVQSLQINNTVVANTRKRTFACTVTMTYDKKNVSFSSEVDSGSDITTLPLEMYRTHFSNVLVKPLTAGTNITRYGKSRIHGVLGTIPLDCSFGGRSAKLDVYIMPNQCKALLGKDAMHALGLMLNPNTFEVNAVAEPAKASDLNDAFPNLKVSGCGKFPDYQHVIKLAEGAIPHITKLRTVPLARREAVRNEVQAMVTQGIWEPCEKTEWQHGMVTVPKANGEVRITTDLTSLNQFVIPNRHPLPNIKDAFLKLRGATVFSKLDLTKAYYTIPIAPESRPLTATVTDQGVFQYKCLPMGLKDSAAVFQKCVANTLDGISGCIHYIDDILIYGQDRVSHDLSLKKALAALNTKHFQLNADKSLIAQSSVPFLGHIISAEGIYPSPRRIEPIKNSPPPTDMKGVQRLLGFIRYYQDFVPGLATLIEPLHRLTRKDVPFQWDAECQKAFKTVMSLLADKLLVSIFDPQAPTFVTTDASQVGLGAALSQMQDGKEVYVAFASRTLRPHERNYAANEAEALACLWACEYWEKFLIGRPFVLRTDHSALQTLLQKHTSSRTSAKFYRWRERLAAFDYTVEYRKGQENIVADALSRMPIPAIDLVEYDKLWERKIEAITLKSGVTLPRLKQQTSDDKFCSDILRYIERQKWPSKERLTNELKPYYALRHDFRANNNLIVRSDERIVVPVSMRRHILESAHEGHPGVVRMKRLLKVTYWWPGINSEIELFVKHCAPCQRSEKSCPPLVMPQQHLPEAHKPWQLVSRDITGQFDVAPHSQRFICVLLDHFSGFPEIQTFGTITSTAIIAWLEELFARYGYPSELLSDNGTQFISQEFIGYLNAKGIRHRRSAVYNPQSNAKVEVFNRYLKHGVQTFAEGRWKENLLSLVRTFRATAPSPEGQSPAAKLHGWPMRLSFQPAPVSNCSGVSSPVPVPASQHPTSPTGPRPESSAGLLKNRGPYRPGETVLVRRPPAKVLKGQSPWSSPLRVKKTIGNYTYLLSDGQVWNARRIRRFFQPAEEDSAPIDNVLGQAVIPRRSRRIPRPPDRWSPSP